MNQDDTALDRADDREDGTAPFHSFEEGGVRATLWASRGAAKAQSSLPPRANGSPARLELIYLHVYDGDGSHIVHALEELSDTPFVLVAMKPDSWNDDLTPWECPGLFAGDAPFKGNAREHLTLLQERIMPHAERIVAGRIHSTECEGAQSSEREKPRERNGARPPLRRTIAGYSLAGLFATWAVFNSGAFSCVASASGSLWYPDFDRYVARRSFARVPECASFSLGTKEAKTPSRLLRNVAAGAESVIAAFRAKGVPTHFA